MPGPHHVLAFLVAAAVLTATPVRAQWSDPEAHFAGSMTAGMRLQDFITQAHSELRKADLNMDGVVNAADAQRQAEEWPRWVRSPALAELLRNDLDFDGVIALDEVVRAQGFQIRRNAYLHRRESSTKPLCGGRPTRPWSASCAPTATATAASSGRRCWPLSERSRWCRTVAAVR